MAGLRGTVSRYMTAANRIKRGITAKKIMDDESGGDDSGFSNGSESGLNNA